MNFKNTIVSNFEGAFRGLRNPLESWHKADSMFGLEHIDTVDQDYEVASYYAKKNGYSFDKDYELWYDKTEEYTNWLRDNGILRFSNDIIEYAYIGPNDLDLAQRMISAGDSDSKFLRQINVSVDITAPLYWWKEMDQYKVGTITNSTSTMHKLASTPITMECFETDDLQDVVIEDSINPAFVVTSKDTVNTFIYWLEKLRKKYNETKDQQYWKELIRWLPEGWLQTRTWTSNYTVLRNIYFQRQHHRLSEWHKFCEWVETLPYAKELILYKKEIDK